MSTSRLCTIALTGAILGCAPTLLAQTAPTPTGPFLPPVTGYSGRYLDSSVTPGYQCCPRTYRAQIIKVAPERDAIYMMIGSTFVRQTLSAFLGRIGSESMIELAGAGVVRPGPRELYLQFDDWTDPERTHTWTTPSIDGQDRLMDFDWDDRGLTYLAYSIWGFGIVDANLDLVKQVFDSTISPQSIFAFRNGDSYYVDIADLTGSAIYDVTTSDSPLLSRPGSAFVNWARLGDGHIAMITPDRNIVVHTVATLLAGGAPLLTLNHATGLAFNDITSDGTRFYALESSTTAGTIHTLTPSGATFADTTVDAPASSSTTIDYGAGYLVVGTAPTLLTPRAALYSLSSGVPIFRSELPTDYFTIATNRSLVPLTLNGETTLLAGMTGVGDVFTLETPPIDVQQQFAPQIVLLDRSSDLTITLTNFDSAPVATFDLSHTLPAELVNTAEAPTTTCGGSLAVTPGTSAFVLTGGAIGAQSRCTITLHLTSAFAGSFASEIPASAIASADNTNAYPSSATLTLITGAPESLSASASSASQIELSWSAVPGATGYEIDRGTLISAVPYLTTTAETSYSDSGLEANRTYLYQVRAIISGATPPPSAIDPATTIVFTDSLFSGIPIKATHIAELRTAVNAMRAAAGLPAATFTDAALTPHLTKIKAAHIAELRTALTEARTAIGLTTAPYTDPFITAGTTKVKATHIVEVRADTQ